MTRVKKDGRLDAHLRRGHLVLGTRITYLALPWFVLVTNGSAAKMTLVLAAEIAPMVVLGIPSGSSYSASAREHDAYRGLRARADPRLDTRSCTRSTSSPFRSCSASSRCSGASCRGTSRRSGPSCLSSSARTSGECRGEQPHRGWGPWRRSSARRSRPAHPVPRHAERALRRRCHLRRRLPPRARLRPAAEADRRRVRPKVLAGVRFLFQDRLFGPIACVVVGFGFLSAGMSAGLVFYANDELENSRIVGLFYAALGAGALVGTFAAIAAGRKVPPLRLSGWRSSRSRCRCGCSRSSRRGPSSSSRSSSRPSSPRSSTGRSSRCSPRERRRTCGRWPSPR